MILDSGHWMLVEPRQTINFPRIADYLIQILKNDPGFWSLDAGFSLDDLSICPERESNELQESGGLEISEAAKHRDTCYDNEPS